MSNTGVSLRLRNMLNVWSWKHHIDMSLCCDVEAMVKVLSMLSHAGGRSISCFSFIMFIRQHMKTLWNWTFFLKCFSSDSFCLYCMNFNLFLDSETCSFFWGKMICLFIFAISAHLLKMTMRVQKDKMSLPTIFTKKTQISTGKIVTISMLSLTW